MAPSKRVSVGNAPSPKKARKGRPADPNRPKMQAIVKELTSSKDLLPAGVADMLTSMAPFALLTPKEERHQFMSELTDMVGSNLDFIMQALEKEISTKQTNTENYGDEKLSRERLAAEAGSTLPKLQEAKSAADITFKEKKSVEAAAKSAFDNCQRDQIQGDETAHAAESKKESLLKLVQQDLACMKEVAANTTLAKAALKRIQKSSADFGIDASVVTGLPSVLKKDPALRSSFEKMIMDQFEGEVHKKVAECDSTLDALRPAREERAAATDKAQKELEVVADERKAAGVVHDESTAALKQGKDQLKVAEQSVRSFLPDMKVLFDTLDKDKRRLAEFREGPITFFAQLRDLEKPSKADAEEAVLEVKDEEMQPTEVEKTDLEQPAEIANAEVEQPTEIDSTKVEQPNEMENTKIDQPAELEKANIEGAATAAGA